MTGNDMKSDNDFGIEAYQDSTGRSSRSNIYRQSQQAHTHRTKQEDTGRTVVQGDSSRTGAYLQSMVR